MGDARMDEVELVEDGAPEPLAVPAAGLRDRWVRLRPSRRSWWFAVAGLLVVALATTVVTQRRESSRMAAFAQVPGILAPIDGPLTRAWSTDFGSSSSLAAFAGRVLSVQQNPDESVEVAAFDQRTGRQVWRTQVRAAVPVEVTGTELTGAQFSTGALSAPCAMPARALPTDEPDARRTIACVVVDAMAAIEEGEDSYRIQPTSARLVIVDAATGRVLSSESTPPSTAVATLGADLVLSDVDAHGRLLVRRTDATATATRWTFTNEPPDESAAGTSSWLAVSGDLISVVSWDAGADARSSRWLLGLDGRERQLATAPDAAVRGDVVAIAPLSDGRRVLEQAEADDGTLSLAITDVATGRSVTTTDYPAGVALDDGSLPDLVLTQPTDGSRLIALDLATGRERWSVGVRSNELGAATLIVLEGQVLATGSKGLLSIDGSSGEVTWSVPVTGMSPTPLVTDGRTVLLTRSTRGDADGGSGDELLAYDVSDGDHLWTSQIDAVARLEVVDGALYGFSSEMYDASPGFIAFGAAP